METQRTSGRKSVAGRVIGRGPHVSLERRLHPRRPAVDYRIWVGGWVSEGEFAAVAARLDDIGLGGARITSTVPFPEGEDVWMRPGGSGYVGSVRGEVLECVMAESGDFVTRVRFYEECPESFLSIVTRGPRG